MPEQSLVFIKPGNYPQWFDIITTLDNKLKSIRSLGIHVCPVPEELIREHYRNIQGKSFYEPTINAFLKSKEGIFLTAYKGENIIKRVRDLIGDTDPKKAKPGTIRNIFGKDSFAEAYRERRYLNNIIHASANKKEAEREIKIWRDYIKF